MLSILVCHSYFLRLDQKQLDRAKPYPPLATLQVAAMLRKAGHRVALFDAMLAEHIEEFQERLRAHAPQLVVIYEDNYNFLSKMCLAAMRHAACQMIGGARAAGSRVIVAGSDASDAPDAYLEAGADVVLIGEGLTTLMECVARLSECPRLGEAQLAAGLAGVAHAGRPRPAPVRAAKHRGPPAEPGSPAWDLIDVERYRTVWRAAHGYFSLNMAASRGCSFRCTWCAKPIWGQQYLQRRAAEVATEMTQLKRRFAPDHVWFADDIFGFRPEWVRELAAALASTRGGLPFTIQSRADLMSERMVDALQEAGCIEVWLGAESGSQRILDAMNKGITVEELLTARARLKQRGIAVGFFIQLGYLGEDLEDILATRDLIATARPDDVGVSVAYPLPGTRFYDLVKAQLGRKRHWNASDDLAMMFSGTFTSDFYRAVRNLLHEQVRLRHPAPGSDVTAHLQAVHALNQRWESLVGSAEQFRNPTATLPPDQRAEAPAASGRAGHLQAAAVAEGALRASGHRERRGP